MDFLKKKFMDEISADIDDEGMVNILGSLFEPSEILQTLDLLGFDDAFLEWSEQKKADRLEKANEILKLYDNQGRFTRLKETYRQGAVMPFVGAGMSMSSGYPSWTVFLRQLLSETRLNEQDLEHLLSTFQYEEAAQLLFNNMPEGSFNESLDNTFSHDKGIDGAVRFLPSCFSSSGVITTNFDNVLKKCFEMAGQSFSEVLLGGEAEELPRYLAQGENVLVKLHGKANSSRNRVLTYEEYQTHYGSDVSKLKDVIHSISNKTLLFLGCSLGEDRTVKCLEQVFNNKGPDAATRHYAFFPVKDDNERLDKRDSLVKANIYPIWYSIDDDHDECIAALLEKLREGMV